MGNLTSYVLQRRLKLQYVLVNSLNKYFIAQIAGKYLYFALEKVKTGISDNPSPGEIKS